MSDTNFPNAKDWLTGFQALMGGNAQPIERCLVGFRDYYRHLANNPIPEGLEVSSREFMRSQRVTDRQTAEAADRVLRRVRALGRGVPIDAREQCIRAIKELLRKEGEQALA